LSRILYFVDDQKGASMKIISFFAVLTSCLVLIKPAQAAEVDKNNLLKESMLKQVEFISNNLDKNTLELKESICLMFDAGINIDDLAPDNLTYRELKAQCVHKYFNINERNARGRTFLHYAVEADNFWVVKILVENGAAINIQTLKQCYTPLHFANRNSCNIIAEFLGRCGADSSLKDKAGIKAADATAARQIAKQDTGINQKDQDGNTMLHIAYREKFKEAQKILLDYGADPTIKNNRGQIPSELGK